MAEMRTSIRERRLGGERVRWLLVNGTIESAVSLEEGRRDELLFPYLKQLACAFGMRDGISRTLLLGGGGFAYPRYYISHYPDKKLDVVEISPEMIRIAREHFYLDDLIREQGMAPGDVLISGGQEADPGSAKEKTPPRLRVFCEDAFNYLLRCPGRYDFIIDDAYAGHRAVGKLRSDDGIRLIRSRLSPGGIYAVNVVSAMRGLLSSRKRAAEKLIGRHFRYMTAVPCDESAGGMIPQNVMMFASDEAL